jgi:hypothetical protein
LLRAVTGGARDGYAKANIISCEHLARTQEPETKHQISNIFVWISERKIQQTEKSSLCNTISYQAR